MTTITSKMVKDLRESTGVGMMDCKKALMEVNGDMEAAVDLLRKKGLSAAAKKAGRVAAEGLVGVYTKGTTGTVVEVNTETDFVARNEEFQSYVRQVTELAASVDGDIEKLKGTSFPGTDRNVGGQLTHLVATIGENMQLRRAAMLSVNQGVVTSYVHNKVAPGLGRIGVIVALESAGDSSKIEEVGKLIAMHAAALHPHATTVEDLDPKVVERERSVFKEQAIASGKPPEFVDKMVEGRLRKFYQQVVLTEQIFVVDGERRIKQVIEDAAKEIGSRLSIKGFVRFALGEGVEKKASDFATEVAAQLGK